MVEYSFPTHATANQIGKRHPRLDGPVKSTGQAKYSYDMNLPGMLHAKLLLSPYAHARITKLDVEAARRLPGVEAVQIIQDVGSEIQWAHDELVAVAATSEDIARDALRLIDIEYEILDHFVEERLIDAALVKKEPSEKSQGDLESALKEADARVSNTLGLPMIAHMCLEAHGQVATWQQDELTVYASTQSVSVLPQSFVDGGIDVPAANIRIRTDYMGGGFGSKFNPDRWGIVGAQLARTTGKPVKIFLDRDQEVAVAGSRPSAWAKMEIGGKKDGRITAWRSESWGSGGLPGTNTTPIPYLFDIENQEKSHTSVSTNKAGSRAWRAPNHPQACFMTLSMIDDFAAAIGMDPVQVLRRNLDLAPAKLRATWTEQLDLAEERMQWSRYRPRPKVEDVLAAGGEHRGLGVSMHSWGGRGHSSRCEVIVQPDGSVEARLGTQDLGTGTRTIIAMVLADTFGLRHDEVRVSMGDSRFPQSGPSGGSSTVGGVSASTRRAAQNALAEILTKVAAELGVDAELLEARDGRIQNRNDHKVGMAWSRAAALLGATPLSANGRNPGKGQLNDSGVGGVQMAEVSVDVETGVVTLEKLMAIQDCGLVINPKLAESQMHGGMIMGIGYALFEELIDDPVTGRVLNADMEFYRLAGLVDVGKLDVHMMTGPGHDERGVIGLGEPPVISPGAAISNAVANAIGVRVGELPLTPDRVLEALAQSSPTKQGGRRA